MDYKISDKYGKLVAYAGLAATLCLGTCVSGYAGDGSDEPGFVAPPRAKKLPPAPPRVVSSAETFIPGGCTTPMARTEAKRPPQPPTLITKLTDK
jgi:hypothetical protein